MDTKRNKMVLSGYTFEEIVADEASKVCSEFKILRNRKFYSNRISRGTECDVILITSKNLYCIECKNYNGYIRGNRLDETWVFTSSGYKSRVCNPVMSNHKHIRTIRGIMYYLHKMPLDFENVVCVPSKCKIHSTCSEVMTIGELRSRLLIDEYSVDRYNVDMIYNFLESISYT